MGAGLRKGVGVSPALLEDYSALLKGKEEELKEWKRRADTAEQQLKELSEAISLANVAKARIKHLQSLQARHTPPSEHPHELPSDAPLASMGSGVEATASSSQLMAVGNVASRRSKLKPLPPPGPCPELNFEALNFKARKSLRDLKLFVLDNSIRESTVGQTIGHNVEDKLKILDQVRSLGFEHIVVASFGHSRRVDDEFCKLLKMKPQEAAIVGREESSSDASKFNNSHKDLYKRKAAVEGVQFSQLYSFSELFDTIQNEKKMGLPKSDALVPEGLQRMREYGLRNPIIEVDVNNKLSIAVITDQLEFLLKWVQDKMKPESSCRDYSTPRVFVNLRDASVAMIRCPQRIRQVVSNLGCLPPDIRPCGILYEDAIGEVFPEEWANWTRSIRSYMDEVGWISEWQRDGKTVSGLLLFHVHNQWGLADAAVLSSLASGADGVWASVAEEGAAQGHACSCITIANLARLGNKDVIRRYKTTSLADAARNVTKWTINHEVHPRQAVYGPRAIETVFGFSGIAGGSALALIDNDGDKDVDDADCFSLAKFLGLDKAPIRLSSLASEKMWQEKLIESFGEHADFTMDMAVRLKTLYEEELIEGEQNDINSLYGLAEFYRRSIEKMKDSVKMDKFEISQLDGLSKSIPESVQQILDAFKNSEDNGGNDFSSDQEEKLLAEALEFFNKSASSHGVVGTNTSTISSVESGPITNTPARDVLGTSLSYEAFYHEYLQPYFERDMSEVFLNALDPNSDKRISWDEWKVWCKWAYRSKYEHVHNLEDMHRVIVREGILVQILQTNSADSEGRGRAQALS